MPDFIMDEALQAARHRGQISGQYLDHKAYSLKVAVL